MDRWNCQHSENMWWQLFSIFFHPTRLWTKTEFELQHYKLPCRLVHAITVLLSSSFNSASTSSGYWLILILLFAVEKSVLPTSEFSIACSVIYKLGDLSFYRVMALCWRCEYMGFDLISFSLIQWEQFHLSIEYPLQSILFHQGMRAKNQIPLDVYVCGRRIYTGWPLELGSYYKINLI